MKKLKLYLGNFAGKIVIHECSWVLQDKVHPLQKYPVFSEISLKFQDIPLDENQLNDVNTSLQDALEKIYQEITEDIKTSTPSPMQARVVFSF